MINDLNFVVKLSPPEIVPERNLKWTLKILQVYFRIDFLYLESDAKFFQLLDESIF